MATVLDIGSDTIKAGIAGNYAPTAVYPSIIGEERNQFISLSHDKNTVVGDEAQLKREMLHLKYPVERGVITDWDGLETILKHTFSKLFTVEAKIDTVLLSEIPLNSKICREMIATLMFEKFNVNRMFLMNEAVLALYSTGRVTGLVVDSGHGVTHTVPIYEGYSLLENINRIEMGGQDVTDYLAQLLLQKGYYLTSSIEKEIVRNIKETLAYISLDFKDEMRLKKQRNQEKVYNLPDGQSIYLTSELFQCAESIFHPHIIGITTGGLAQCAFSSLKRCDTSLHEQLAKNIIFSGGNTMLPNTSERMKIEMNQLSPTSLKVDCTAHSERKYSAWIGGSIIATLNNFKSMWITKQEYTEYGPQIIHRKCI